MTKSVVIVGGGITGLVAAYRLGQTGLPISIRLLEGSARLGGRIQTERRDGFLMELGPDVMLSRKPHGAALCKELGLEVIGARAENRGAYLLCRRGLYRLPEGLSTLAPSRLGPVFTSRLLSPWGKARVALDLVLPPRQGDEDESVAAFFSRRLGREAYQRLVAPLLGGMSGGDAADLSLRATFPHLRALEIRHGSLLRGLAKERRPSALISVASGMDRLVSALKARLPDGIIHLKKPVEEITRGPAGYTARIRGGAQMQADCVLVAAPAYAGAKILAPLDEDLSCELGAIDYSATITIQLAFRQEEVPHPLDAYGYIASRPRAVVACTWTSSKLNGRAPEGGVLLRLFMGRRHSDPLFAQDDDALQARALSEVRATLGITATPLLCRVHRWPRALPRFALGHTERLARIEQRRRTHPGLFLAGAAFGGAGVPDCIKDGERAADAIRAWFSSDTQA